MGNEMERGSFMINRSFYKEISFWGGVVLVFLENYVVGDIIEGRFFAIEFWEKFSNIEGIIFFVLGFSLILKSIIYVKTKKTSTTH